MLGMSSTPQSFLMGQPANLPTDITMDDPLPDIRISNEHIQQMLEAQEAGRTIIKNILQNRALEAKQICGKNITSKVQLHVGMVVY